MAHPSPTAWAQKYGVAKEPWLQHYGKSGLTPITPTENLAYSPTLEQWMLREFCVDFQETMFDGFTTKRFIDAGAVGDRPETRPSNLTEIHPLFARERWETSLPAHLAFYPLGHGVPGYWRADNDAVWRVLEPCLALASKFVTHSEAWSWWDALIWGEKHEIPSPPAPPNYERPLFRFHMRPFRQVYNNGGPLPTFEAVAQRVVFGISSSHVDPHTGLSINENGQGAWHGMTMYSAGQANRFGVLAGSSKLVLAHEDLAPLLFHNLTPAEILISQFQIGFTLVHELAHLVYQTIMDTTYPCPEPYFESEAVSELGNSLSNSIFGGDFYIANSNRNRWWHLRDRPPLALVFDKGWPNVEQARVSSWPCLDPTLEAGIGNVERYPVPISWLSDIQQSSYWDNYVRTFGLSAVRPAPLTYGLRSNSQYQLDGSIVSSTGIIWGDFDEDYIPYSLAPFAIETLEAINARQSRIKMGLEIQAALRYGMYMDSVDVGKRRERFAEAELSAFRLPGETRELPVLLDQKKDRKFDRNMPQPMYYDQIKDHLLRTWDYLALSTMTNWTPANLFLDYMNRSLPALEFVPRDHFYDFLTYCECHKTLFRFRRRASGIVRRVNAGWPLHKRARKLPNLVDYPTSAIHQAVAKIFVDKEDEIFEDNLFDYAYEFLYLRFMESLKDYPRDAQIEGIPIPFNMTREDFHAVMLHFNAHRAYIVLGPPGIYRLIEQGWPNPLKKGPEEDVDSSDHSTDSDFGD